MSLLCVVVLFIHFYIWVCALSVTKHIISQFLWAYGKFDIDLLVVFITATCFIFLHIRLSRCLQNSLHQLLPTLAYLLTPTLLRAIPEHHNSTLTTLSPSFTFFQAFGPFDTLSLYPNFTTSSKIVYLISSTLRDLAWWVFDLLMGFGAASFWFWVTIINFWANYFRYWVGVVVVISGERLWTRLYSFEWVLVMIVNLVALQSAKLLRLTLNCQWMR